MTVLYSIQSPEMLLDLDMYPVVALIEYHLKERHLLDEGRVDGIFGPHSRRKDAVLVLGTRFQN